MRFSIVFVLLMLLSMKSEVLCAEVFSLAIRPQSRYFESNSILNFDFTTKSSETSFRIRPLVSNGGCYVYSTETVYISCSDIWTKMPTINVALKIKLTATTPHVFLAFQIQNITTARIVETNRVLLVKKSLAEQYLSKINANILNVGSK